jgi:hypothetical protein
MKLIKGNIEEDVIIYNNVNILDHYIIMQHKDKKADIYFVNCDGIICSISGKKNNEFKFSEDILNYFDIWVYETQDGFQIKLLELLKNIYN